MNTIKKLLCITLALLSICSLTACAVKGDAPTAYKSALKESAVITCGEKVLNATYTYKDGLLVKETFTNAEGTEFSNFYIYNDEGQCTSEVHNNPDGTKDKYRHTFDGNGVKTKTVHTNPSGSKNTCVYLYDEAGTLVTHVLTTASKEVINGVYAYNELGGIDAILYHNDSGTVSYAVNYVRDIYGNVVKEVSTESGSEITTTYEYIYQTTAQE